MRAVYKDKESGKTDKKNPMPASVADNGLLQINSGTGVVDFAIDEKNSKAYLINSEELESFNL